MAIESHSYAGIQFPGRPEVGVILAELERQKKARQDMVLRSDRFEVAVHDQQMLLSMPADPKTTTKMLVPMTRRVFTQIAQWMGLRMTDRYYKWLSMGAQTPNENTPRSRNWKAWAHCINDFLHTEKAYRLVRLMANTNEEVYCRALLGDKYKIIPNADFFYSICEKLQEAKAEIWHARLSEDKFYGYAVSPGIAAQIDTDRGFDPGDGWKSRWYGKKDDVVNAAMSFGNSETGDGGCFIGQAILRRVCINYCVWHDVVNKVHLGKRNKEDMMLSDETILKQNDALFSAIGDYVKGTFHPEEFQKLVDSLNGATQDVVEDPEKAANALQVVYDISEDRKAQIRNLFIRNQDCSRYGLLNAVTEYAHDKSLDADRGFEFEKLGAELASTTMDQLYTKAERMSKDKEKRKKEATGALVGASAALDDQF